MDQQLVDKIRKHFLVYVARESAEIFRARMMGGGFGGCTINLVKKEKVDSVVQAAGERYTTRFSRSLCSFKVYLEDGT